MNPAPASMSRVLAAAVEEVYRLEEAGLTVTSVYATEKSGDARDPMWTLCLDGDQEEAADLLVLAGYYKVKEIANAGGVLGYYTPTGSMYADRAVTVLLNKRSIDAASERTAA